MSGLGYFDQADVVDRANFPDNLNPEFSRTKYEEEEASEHVADSTSVPEAVKKFIRDFHKAFRVQDSVLIFQLYEGDFNELSEKHYKTTHWPKVEAIAEIVKPDPLFLVLYKEMYFRHIYSIDSGRLVTLEDRVESFQNYFNLFSFILKHSDKLEMDLPNQWIWDIVDEFIWQYSDYARFRSRLARLNSSATKDKEVESLAKFVRNQEEVWSVIYVIQTLNALAEKSNIVAMLDAERKAGGAEILELSGKGHFFQMLGYYSIIGLVRVHTLLGDYHSAIKTIDCIDFTKRVQLFSKVVACHITLFYYTGFVFMMLRRYSDAIKFFTQLLSYIARIKNIHARAYPYDDIVKKNEQIYHLLALTLSLCPQRSGIDEVVLTTLKERLGEKLTRLTQGDLDVYSDIFKYACPKFVSWSTDFSDDNTSTIETLELQRSVFMNEVSQQLVLSTIRSYLSLYSTISVGKLASFMEQDNVKVPEHVFRTYLMRLKHKTRQLVWTGGRPSEGERQSTSDVGFYIDKDMVFVQPSSKTTDLQQRSHAQYFVEQIRYIKPCLDALCGTKRG